ncbi:MAG: hypothetical protein ACKVOL_09365 [Novosphingobium sp.]
MKPDPIPLPLAQDAVIKRLNRLALLQRITDCANRSDDLSDASDEVLKEICEHMRWDFGSANHLIEIAPQQFLQPTFCAHVQRVLLETGVSPECLRLEMRHYPGKWLLLLGVDRL